MTSAEKKMAIKCICGKSLSVPPGMVGKKVQCPGCKAVLCIVQPAPVADNSAQWQQKLKVLGEKFTKVQERSQETLKEQETALKEKDAVIKEKETALKEKEEELKKLQKEMDSLAKEQTDMEEMKDAYESEIEKYEKDCNDKTRIMENIRTQLIKLSQQIG